MSTRPRLAPLALRALGIVLGLAYAATLADQLYRVAHPAPVVPSHGCDGAGNAAVHTSLDRTQRGMP